MAPEIPPTRPASPPKGVGPNGKITNRLVALGSAAVLTVYAAGYARTRSAADRFVVEAADLRTGAPLDLATPAVAVPPPGATETVVEAPPPVDASAPVEKVASAEPVRTEPLKPAPATTSEPAAAPAASEPAAPPAPTAASTESTPQPAADTVADANTTTGDTPATPAAPQPAAPPASQYKDGRFLGWGYSRHGDIEADIVIVNGRIVSTQITQCLTRYSCDVIAQSPGQVLERQSPYIDIVGGATESANAYANAVYRAMKAAKN